MRILGRLKVTRLPLQTKLTPSSNNGQVKLRQLTPFPTTLLPHPTTIAGDHDHHHHHHHHSSHLPLPLPSTRYPVHLSCRFYCHLPPLPPPHSSLTVAWPPCLTSPSSSITTRLALWLLEATLATKPRLCSNGLLQLIISTACVRSLSHALSAVQSLSTVLS